ncbi:granzyme E-like isoform X2 [Acomys russatus]|uniref:granzyme E-like isoform X2 n=1 Tax=Acomys russatus TaxID=60746 RepID=UPI0021E30612|nr:granzyme E-like isoform X2 [Acomys russatus]
MTPVLILLAFLLHLGVHAEEIIGGHEVKPHSRPYMAFVKSVEEDGKSSRCGGFLVQDSFVLTAAHCRGSSMTVTLGAHNIMAQEQTQQIIPVAKAIPHPDYNSESKINDIMLLKLERKAKKTKAVKLLKLTRANARLRPGKKCHVAGWGMTSFDATKGSDVLQEAELSIQVDQQCEKRFPHYSKTTEICAGDPKKEQLAFQGDTGGPLVCDNRAHGLYVPQGNEALPNIFTKISFFLPWIKKNMKLP